MVRRRRTPPANGPQGNRKPDTSGPITSASSPPDSPGPALAVPHHSESVHDALLESVSPEALQSHEEVPGDAVGGTIAEAVPEPAPAADPEPAVQATHDGAHSEGFAVAARDPAAIPEEVSSEALEPHEETSSDPVIAPVSEPTRESEPAAAADAQLLVQAANDSAPSGISDVEADPVPVAVPRRAAAAPAFRKVSALDALNELTESNATVVAFLRNEGSATLAHLRSLAGARSAADVVRLQMNEMQRAADASLTCVGTLAKRAGRFANFLGRR